MIKINVAKIAHEFETETCSRCGGSGQYSYCQQYGTMCFKCHGKKIVNTKRGQAARELYTKMASKPLSEVKPGDIVWSDNMFGKSGWLKVEGVVRGGDGCYTISPDGGCYDPINSYTLRMDGTAHHNMTGDSLVRVKQSKGQSLRLRRIALQRQARLNKSGK